MDAATAAAADGATKVSGLPSALLLGALLVVALVAATVVWGPRGGSKSPPPPSPPPSSYLPGGPMYRFYTAPHTLVDVLHALHAALPGPTFRFPFGLRTVTVTCNPADCARIVGRPGEWLRPPAMVSLFTAVSPGGLFVMPRRAHAGLRRGLRGVFGPAMLPAFWPALQREMATMMVGLERERRRGDGAPGVGGGCGGDDAAAAARGGIDISAAFRNTTYRLVFTVAFGASYEEATMTRVIAANGALLDAMLTDVIGYPVRQWRMLAPLRLRAGMMAVCDDLRALYRTLVDARLAETPEAAAERVPDLLDQLVDLGGRDAEAAVSNALIFGAAGGATTADTASWTVFHIATTPGCAEAVEAELDAVVGPPGTPLAFDHLERLPYLRACWKEALRISPPGPIVERIAARDSVLPGSGLAVAAGTPMLAFVGAAHRDPTAWPRAGAFEPRRWLPAAPGAPSPSPPLPGAWMPFSLGPENCAGTFLADFEGLLLLATLHHAYTIRPVNPEGVVSVAGWATRAGSYDPAGPPGNVHRGVAVTLHPRGGQGGGEGVRAGARRGGRTATALAGRYVSSGGGGGDGGVGVGRHSSSGGGGGDGGVRGAAARWDLRPWQLPSAMGI